MISENPYIRNPGRSPYLKCIYGEGMHPSERSVAFTTTAAKPDENPLFVRVEGKICIDPEAFENMATVDVRNITPAEGSDQGLLGILDIFSDDGTKSLIKIPDKGNGGTSRKLVPNSEIVWR